MTWRRVCLTLLLSCSLTGCGTFIARDANSPLDEGGFYRGTQGDIRLLTGNLPQDKIAMTVICWYTIVCPIAVVGSMPVDFVLDTAMLPFDAYNATR